MINKKRTEKEKEKKKEKEKEKEKEKKTNKKTLASFVSNQTHFFQRLKGTDPFQKNYAIYFLLKRPFSNVPRERSFLETVRLDSSKNNSWIGVVFFFSFDCFFIVGLFFFSCFEGCILVTNPQTRFPFLFSSFFFSFFL